MKAKDELKIMMEDLSRVRAKVRGGKGIRTKRRKETRTKRRKMEPPQTKRKLMKMIGLIRRRRKESAAPLKRKR